MTEQVLRAPGAAPNTRRMFSTCIFCHADLGKNELVERFSTGRRLAFDAARGRLWVVCRTCARWNLTPLETRWEAFEECERLYRDTARRVATDNIGLARLSEGLELVRIGDPLRPEFAAWRYGDQFGRRRRHTLARGSAVAVAGAGLLLGGPLIGLTTGAIIIATNLGVTAASAVLAQKTRSLVPHPDGGTMLVSANELPFVRLTLDGSEGWLLEVPYHHMVTAESRWWERNVVFNLPFSKVARLQGPEAVRAAAQLLARINRTGARADRVRDAVNMIEDAGGPDRFFPFAAAHTREWASAQAWGDTGALRHLPPPVRLALEMAANEENEREALEGELAALEQAWRDAEEIAAIADRLVLPPSVEQLLRRMKGRRLDDGARDS